MKIKNHFLMAFSAFSLIGCGSSTLPMPEGNKILLNQTGIPIDLALAINNEHRTVLPATSVKSGEIINNFSHAKNNSVTVANTTKTIPTKFSSKQTITNNVQASNTAKNPFNSASIESKTSVNSIVPQKMTSPISTTVASSNPVVDKNKANPLKINLVENNKNVITTPKSLLTTPMPTSIKVKDLPKTWLAGTGSTLKNTLLKWSENEKCNSREKWEVIWPLNIDYRIDSALSFTGSYFEAVVKIFELYKGAKTPLYVDIYKNQCIISVTDMSHNK